LFQTPWLGRRSEWFTVNDPSAGSPTERRNLWKLVLIFSIWFYDRLEAVSLARALFARTRDRRASERRSYALRLEGNLIKTWLLVTHCNICPHCYLSPGVPRVRCGIFSRPHAVAGALGISCNWVALRSFTNFSFFLEH